jgi:hypothetical protein
MTLEEAQFLVGLTASFFQGLLAALHGGTLDAKSLQRACFAIQGATRDTLKESMSEPSSTPHAAPGIDLRGG